MTGEKKSLVTTFGDKYGVEASKVLDTLKNTAFKVEGGVSNEQMMALLIVADQHNLNPFTKEIYAFPDKHNGVVPVVGVDGWARIINDHAMFDGMTFGQSSKMVTLKDAKPCPEWITCTIYRKDRAHPVEVSEHLDEVWRPTLPWKSHTKRMLRHKAMIQCARLAFSFSGIYDPDEAERITEAAIVDVTPRAPQPDVAGILDAIEAQPTKANGGTDHGE